MTLATFTVNAGWHRRRSCPVQAIVRPVAAIDPTHISLIDKTTDTEIPVQGHLTPAGDLQLHWTIEDMAAQESRQFELRQSAPAAKDGVTLQTITEGKLNIFVAGDHFTTYNYGANVIRPYLYPVLAPDGTGITRDWPMNEDAPGDTTDHVHHRGIWTAHGEVNRTVDNWQEGEGHGWQIHQNFNAQFSGPVIGGFQQNLAWTDHEKQVNLTETRSITIYQVPALIRLLDYQVTLHASAGEVVLADTKEAGLISIRVATSMDARNENGGRIENGFGGIQEDETWGKRAPWCHYSGPIRDKLYGVALMDHPQNPRHPTFWHVRNYGLMTANCFGLHDFTRDPAQRWDLTIPAGESLTWIYRILIHQSDIAAGQVAERYHDFAHPPLVEQS